MKQRKSKKKSRRKGLYKEDAWNAFSKFIRLRDCYRTTGTSAWALCISCNKRYHFKTLQAGHFIPGRNQANLFYERGCHAQCYNCNCTLKGNTLKYMDALIKLYNKNIIEELRENERLTVQYKTHDYIYITHLYKHKYKELIKHNKKGGLE